MKGHSSREGESVLAYRGKTILVRNDEPGALLRSGDPDTIIIVGTPTEIDAEIERLGLQAAV